MSSALDSKIERKLVKINGEYFFKISNSNYLKPFFMSLVSDSNHWMFISSNGGLTAGRKNSEYSLFPYYTDDKIRFMAEFTGPKTIIKIPSKIGSKYWEPFSKRNTFTYNITRNLYKSALGNKLIFEEVNYDLALTFKYEWCTSNLFGFVKQTSLVNNSTHDIKIIVVDGLKNILPYGVGSELQMRASNLVNAYKRNELETASGVGIYSLSAKIVDKAEPSESLKANIVWSYGFEKPTYLLSSNQLAGFRNGKELRQEIDIKGERGAYYISSEFTLKSQKSKNWTIVGNVNQSYSSIIKIINLLRNKPSLIELLNKDINRGTHRLIKLTASADAFQYSKDKYRCWRHYSNTLFNIMRGGVFDNNYQIEKYDFEKYIQNANHLVYNKLKKVIQELPSDFSLFYLKSVSENSNNDEFKRLSLEYLPLKFSRRHGDPSRPWNKFSINTHSEVDGSKILDYEGNWRDLFQNWEALALSYPEFLDGMIAKFLNASTFDGYNPYRVTKDGFDWETIEPDDPWSYIGYWGDHQIIYLLKFLELSERFHPGNLEKYFSSEVFVYANIPYKIKDYQDLVNNPKDTIDFDFQNQEKILKSKNKIGSDGALLKDRNNQIYKVNFIEKLLATLLAKLSNFIPEAGIWMNTQRPEWNDANNALVGNGVSMVTLCYVRRFLTFFDQLLINSDTQSIKLSAELYGYFNYVHSIFTKNRHLIKNSISDGTRKKLLDGLGLAASNYRSLIYSNSFSGNKLEASKVEIQNFIQISLKYVEHTILKNKRTDGLFHAYNLISFSENEIQVENLNEMLEGQVAILSSGLLSSKESLHVLDSLKTSALFRENQYSFMLYPNKKLPGFLSKNVISPKDIENHHIAKKIADSNSNQIIVKDENGSYHFNGNYNNAQDLKSELQEFNIDPNTSKYLLEIFEKVFNHKAFTGRSGTFFGYEGLGSIYWHMVSKLLLAVQECCVKAFDEGASDELKGRLFEHYYEINEGIGVHKSPKLYGAFSTDPYSHTPYSKGAQQPGMTGQVKEDLLARYSEIGIVIKNGKLLFNPFLLRKNEFLSIPSKFKYVNINQEFESINLKEGELCFSFCQVPIVYSLSNKNQIQISYSNNSSETIESLELSDIISKKIFKREGKIKKLKVSLTMDLCN